MKAEAVQPSTPGAAPAASKESPAPRVNGPSSLYSARLWELAVRLSGRLPPALLGRVAAMLAGAYRLGVPTRRRIVFENLLPVFDGDVKQSRRATRELFRQFGLKLADLWRYEAGRPIDGLFSELNGWEHFEAARARGRGVLLLTIHVGNWELGAPLLTKRGVKLQVITQAEPQARLTEIRQAARARWGIETLALGDDPFAAVEIIRRLEANHAVALLMDRPPAATATTVELFGRPFAASVSAAELARASGCALLPVILPRTDRGYALLALPEIPYDRPALRDRGARHELTQRIMRSFEPVIRAHATQWYHFVPIWPRKERG